MKYSFAYLKVQMFSLCIHSQYYSQCFNSSKPIDADMRQYSTPSLVHIMACRLFGTKRLCTEILPYCQLCLKKQFSMISLLELKVFINENVLQALSSKWWPYCLLHNLLGVGHSENMIVIWIGKTPWRPHWKPQWLKWPKARRYVCVSDSPLCAKTSAGITVCLT